MSIENGQKNSSPESETSIEQNGETFIRAIRDALRAHMEHPGEEHQQEIIVALEQIGQAIEEAAQGRKKVGTLPVQYSSASDRFELLLGSGSAGKRIFINMKEYAKFPHDLIFPNAETIKHRITAKSYADAFKEVFGSLCNNRGTDASPYFVVHLLGEEGEG